MPTREEALEIVKDGSELRYLSTELQADKDVVLAAVSNYGHSLSYAPNTLRADKDVVLAAVSNYGPALEWASTELKKDREVVLAAVRNNGSALRYASNELKGDKELLSIRNDYVQKRINEIKDEIDSYEMADYDATPYIKSLEEERNEITRLYGGSRRRKSRRKRRRSRKI